MGRRIAAAFTAVARCLPSTLMVRILRTCIVSQRPSELEVLMVRTTTELFQFSDCFYRAPLCMGRRVVAEQMAMARCLPLTLMARVLRTCIVSRNPLERKEDMEP